MEITVRTAQKGDEHLIIGFIRELAEYEKLTDMMTATPEMLRKNLFEKKQAEAVICERNGVSVGYALFFGSFSTFTALPGIYLEDLFVTKAARGCGCGKALISEVARLACERGCGRLEWSCLDWNEPSLRFYQSLGAKPLSGWTEYRLTGEKLKSLAKLAEEC